MCCKTESSGCVLLMQSLTGSKMVEISEDKKHMRTRDEPGKWSLSGVEPKAFSTLNASVPEFVPGQMFRVATTQSSTPDAQPVSYDTDAAAEVSSRMDDLSVSAATDAEPANSEDASSAALADADDNQDAAIERLNTPPAEEHDGMKNDFVM